MPLTRPILRPWFVGLLLALVPALHALPGSLPWTHRAWQAAEGLPDNTVVGVEQTPDGFLWVGTQGGLVRFDGVRFQEFSPVTAAGEPTSLIQALYLDRRGRLWIAKDRGALVCIDRGRTTTLTSSNGLAMLEVRMIVEDAEGSLWISYLGGDLVRVREEQVRPFTTDDGLPPGSTCQLAMGRDGQLWFARGFQVGVLRGDKFHAATNLLSQRIAACRAGGIWACDSVKLLKYREGQEVESCGALPTDLPGVTPTVLLEDRSGAVWIGTKNAGLFRYDGSNFTKVATSNNEIRCLTEDREGSLWVGTRGGLNRLRPSFVEIVDAGSGVPLEAMRSLCQDGAGQILAVAQSGAVVRKTNSNWHPLTPADGWPINYAQCVAAEAGGGVWIGTQYRGLFLWRHGAIVTNFSTTNGLAAKSVGALLTTSVGDVWIGTESPDMLQHHVQRWRTNGWRTFELPARSGSVAALAVDSGGRVWVGTSGGLLLRFSEESLVNETANTLPVPQAIRSLLATPDGSLWIGYAGRGLGRLQAGRFTVCQRERGLHDDYISQIVADGCGRFWLAGNRGIFYVKQSELEDFMDGRLGRVRSVVFGRNEGLPGTQANSGVWPGALASTDGRVWMPMQSGLAVIEAAGLKDNPIPPPVVIERVSVDGNPVAAYESCEMAPTTDSASLLDLSEAGAHLDLRPGYQQVQIDFTALSLVAPANVEFKHRLHGLEPDWVNSGGRRSVYYPHIPPGNYRFEVIACNDSGIWNETGASLTLTAEPHFWQTLAFQVATPVTAIALGAAGLVFAIRRRHRRDVERLEVERGTERERARIAQDLHDDLGAGLTQISLNTALAQNPAVTPDVAGGLLHEIDQRARELVTALDEIVWAVNPKNDTVPALARYLCQFAQSCLLPAGIACRLEVPPDLPKAPVGAEQRHHLFLAFKEALHNVIQHSAARELNLKILSDVRRLTVTISDNGRGFRRGPAPEGADGLGNMEARLRRLGGSCAVTSAPGQGTTIVFDLPLEGGRK